MKASGLQLSESQGERRLPAAVAELAEAAITWAEEAPTRQANGPPSKMIEQDYFKDIKKDLDRAKAKRQRNKKSSWFG